MREPKFSEAWCFGKEFEGNSKICRVCLANKACQKIFFKRIGASQPVRTILAQSKRTTPKLMEFANQKSGALAKNGFLINGTQPQL